MAKVIKNISKIDWFSWDGKDRLCIQARFIEVDEEDILVSYKGDKLKEKEKEKDKNKDSVYEKELTRINVTGSVKYYFNNVSKKSEVDKILKDIFDGKLK